jgi:phosphoribosyl 1,2-cyclic phosphodiesterase
MTVCSHTGISVPECSCRACLEAQIERHMPSFSGADAASVAPTVEMAALTRFRRLRISNRLRRFRRAA